MDILIFLILRHQEESFLQPLIISTFLLPLFILCCTHNCGRQGPNSYKWDSKFFHIHEPEHEILKCAFVLSFKNFLKQPQNVSSSSAMVFHCLGSGFRIYNMPI